MRIVHSAVHDVWCGFFCILTVLRFERRVLLHTLRSDINAKVCMPTTAEVEAFWSSIAANYSTFGDV